MTTTTPAPIQISSSPSLVQSSSACKREKIANQVSIAPPPLTNEDDDAAVPSDFAERAKMVFELEMVSLRARLFLLEELSTMKDEEKMDYLFKLLNKNHDGSLSVVELADGLRKINGDVGFEESLELAMERVASFDTTGEANLQLDEFQEYVQQLAEAYGATFHDLADMLILSVVFSETGNDELENLAAELVEDTMKEAILLEEQSISRTEEESSNNNDDSISKLSRSFQQVNIIDEVRVAATKATAEKNRMKELMSKLGEMGR